MTSRGFETSTFLYCAIARFYDLLGSVLFLVKKDLNGAEAAFHKSVELDKNNSVAVTKLSAALARQQFELALKIDPNRPELAEAVGRTF